MSEARVAFLLQGAKPEDQIGYHTAFETAREQGRISHYQAFPYRSARTPTDWSALWANVVDHARVHDVNVVYLQYFHGQRAVDPRPHLDRLRSLPTKPIVITSCGDGLGPVGNAPPASLTRAASRSDLFLTTSMGRMARKATAEGCPRVSLLPLSACDIRFGQFELPQHQQQQRDFDVIFIGSKPGGRNPRRRLYWSGKRRASWVHALSKRYGKRLGLFGHGWDGITGWQGPISFGDQAATCRRGQVIFGGYPGSRQPFYTSNRPFIQSTAGVPFVDFHVPGVGRLLQPHRDWLLFDDLGDGLSLIDQVLNDSIDGAAIGAQGASTVRSHHMNSHRVSTIISMVEELLEARKQARTARCPPLDFLVGDDSDHAGPVSIGW